LPRDQVEDPQRLPGLPVDDHPVGRIFVESLVICDSLVPARLEGLDAQLGSALDRPIERVDPVERAILRAGTYELLYSPSVPPAAAINEAVDLAKSIGAEQGLRYVNRVLDRVARSAPSGRIGSDASTG